MSTYTNYEVNVKENLSRTRNPGNADDGMCEQRVIFTNNSNIYYGTFAGQISSEGQTFSNCAIQNGTITGAELNNVTLKNGDEVISISDLTSDVSEISGKNDGIINEVIPSIQKQIEQLSAIISAML